MVSKLGLGTRFCPLTEAVHPSKKYRIHVTLKGPEQVLLILGRMAIGFYGRLLDRFNKSKHFSELSIQAYRIPPGLTASIQAAHSIGPVSSYLRSCYFDMNNAAVPQ